MSRFEGKTVIVTGGARGQGAETVRHFVREGGRAVIADVLAEDGQKLAAEIGEAASFHALDVRDEAQWEAVVAHAESHFGGVDALVNNAGILRMANTLELDPQTFRDILDINLTGAFLGCQAAGRAMVRRGGGAIVNICSVQALMGRENTVAYTASKFGLRGLTKTAACDLGRHNIRVNAVCPGGVDTPMIREPAKDLDIEVTTEMLDMGHAQLPIPRVGQPADMARVTLFLLSEDAAYITGAELAVDGGMTAGFMARVPE